MAKYEDTFTPSERFGDLEFTWDVDFPRLLSNSPEAEQPSEFLKLRSPLTGTGERTNIPEGLSEEDVYQAWNLGMGEYKTLGHHISGGVTDYSHNPTGYPLEYFYDDSTIEEHQEDFSPRRYGKKRIR